MSIAQCMRSSAEIRESWRRLLWAVTSGCSLKGKVFLGAIFTFYLGGGLTRILSEIAVVCYSIFESGIMEACDIGANWDFILDQVLEITSDTRIKV